MEAPLEPGAEQSAEMRRFRMYFPFRMAFCAWKDGEWQVWCAASKSRCNRLLRDGWKVWKC
jgi:hypothetical protein